MMRKLGEWSRWLHRRWGQIVCFAFAAGFLFAPGYDDPISGELPRAVAAGFLLLSGVGLKAVAFWRWGEK